MSETTGQRVLSRILSSIYILAGSLKFPIIPSVYDNMKKQFVNFAGVFPGNAVGIRIDPVNYLHMVGVIETALGVGLLLGSRKVKLYCAEGLMIVMVGAIYTLCSLGEYSQVFAPVSCLTGLTYLWFSYWTNGKKKTQ